MDITSSNPNNLTMLRMVQAAQILDTSCIITTRPGLGVITTLQENLKGKVLIIDCQNLKPSVIAELKKDEDDTVFIFDEFQRISKDIEDDLCVFISDRKQPSIIVCKEENREFLPFFNARCTRINYF